MQRKRIFRDALITLLIVIMCFSLIDVQCVKANPDYDIVIYVDKSLYNNPYIKEAIDIYAGDIQNEGWSNYTIFSDNATDDTPAEIRSILVTCRGLHNIKGCLLIGDFQSAEWVNGTSYYTDYYYMDLNGTWTDADDPPEGKRFNNHTGHIRPEIWVARLMASKLVNPWYPTQPLNETELLLDYFAKNHNHRNASSRVSQAKPRALAYVDNTPAVLTYNLTDEDPVRTYNPAFVNDTVDNLQKAYGEVTLWSSPVLNATNTNATDYRNRLKNGDSYEWTWVYDHGEPHYGTNHAFEKYFWNNTATPPMWDRPVLPDEGIADDHYYLDDTPKTFFYIFGSCAAANAFEGNCVANCAVFGEGNGLTSIGLTEDGVLPAFWFFDAFDQLGQHECIGEAFRTMYNSNIDHYNGNYVYKKIILLGDPTIKINSPPYTPSQPSGQNSGYLEVSYNYTANTTDLNGDQIWYQFDWDDGTNMTVGPYDSGESGNASHAWSCPGTYGIKVRAKDSYDVWSDWSEPLNATIDERIRYMQNAKWDSTYWKLFWNNTSTYTTRSRSKSGYSLSGYLGIRIYNGSDELTSGVVQVGRWFNLEDETKSTTWNLEDDVNVTGTYIKVKIYYKFQGDSWTYMDITFKTETFTENTILNATTWTIYLHGAYFIQGGPLKGRGPGQQRSTISFSWGSDDTKSRIEDMTFTDG